MLIIPICEICGKHGAVEVHQNVTLQSFLSKPDNRRNGFEYGPLIGKTWHIFCEGCKEKSDKLTQEVERLETEFFSGHFGE